MSENKRSIFLIMSWRWKLTRFVAFCSSSECALVFCAKNGDRVLIVNFPKKISPVHVSPFQGVGSAIFLASSTSMLYEMKVTLNTSKDGSCIGGGGWSSPTPHSQWWRRTSCFIKLSCVNRLWSVGSACFIADGSRFCLYTPTQEFLNWVETLCNGHKALMV